MLSCLFGVEKQNPPRNNNLERFGPTPHAEILVWFTLQGKLNTRERLAVLKVIPPMAAICPFCHSAVESISHVLFVCDFSWNLWANCLCWWEMAWCYPKDSVHFFLGLVWLAYRRFGEKDVVFSILCGTLDSVEY